MAKRSMVLFGLSGPVTQPTSEVPGGGDGRRRRGWLRRRRNRLGVDWVPAGEWGLNLRLLLHLRGAWSERFEDAAAEPQLR